MEFQWDPDKELANRRKHGVDFDEAKTVLNDPFELTVADHEHSHGEDRFVSVGRSEADRLIVVSYTERPEDRIRIIGARLAEPRERRSYEQKI